MAEESFQQQMAEVHQQAVLSGSEVTELGVEVVEALTPKPEDKEDKF